MIDVTDPFSLVKEAEDGIYFVKDIPIMNSTTTCRTLWDKGSNRVLIREDFAVSNNLLSKQVTFKIKVVGSVEPKIVQGNIYLLIYINLFHKIMHMK